MKPVTKSRLKSLYDVVNDRRTEGPWWTAILRHTSPSSDNIDMVKKGADKKMIEKIEEWLKEYKKAYL